MSVVVRGLIIPDGCEECKVSCETESGLHCLLVDDGNKWGWKKIESRERPDWCPLVELPHGHGRLIDADEFADEMRKRQDAAGKWLREAKDYFSAGRADAVLNFLCEVKLTLDKMPTIVEAEHEGTNK